MYDLAQTKFRRQHQQALLLILGSWLVYHTIVAQVAQPATSVFPKMPRRAALQPQLLSGRLPGEGYRVSWTPVVIKRQKSWQRDGRVYTPLAFFHNGRINSELSLRQTNTTVYAAIDDYIQRSDAAWADSAWRTQRISEEFLQLIAKSDSRQAQDLRLARTQYDSPLFKFNAKVGEEWNCILGYHDDWRPYIKVKLLRITQDAQQLPLYLFAFDFRPKSSHTPQIQEVVVSPQRGIVGMKWYEYVCFGGPGNCDDWIMQYDMGR